MSHTITVSIFVPWPLPAILIDECANAHVFLKVFGQSRGTVYASLRSGLQLLYRTCGGRDHCGCA